MQGSGLVECVEEQIQAAEETARSEQDLTAQQQAAWGSMLASAWGAIAVVVTAIGTALLYQQIVLTRKAVEDTGDATRAMQDANKIAGDALAHQRDAAERDLRPWITFKLARYIETRSEDEYLFFWVEFEVENLGNFPGTVGVILAHAYPVATTVAAMMHFREARENNEARMAALANSRSDGYVLAPTEKTAIKCFIPISHARWARFAKEWCYGGGGIELHGEVRVFYWWREHFAFVDKYFVIRQADDARQKEGMHTDPLKVPEQDISYFDMKYGRIG